MKQGSIIKNQHGTFERYKGDVWVTKFDNIEVGKVIIAIQSPHFNGGEFQVVGAAVKQFRKWLLPDKSDLTLDQIVERFVMEICLSTRISSLVLGVPEDELSTEVSIDEHLSFFDNTVETLPTKGVSYHLPWHVKHKEAETFEFRVGNMYEDIQLTGANMLNVMQDKRVYIELARMRRFILRNVKFYLVKSQPDLTEGRGFGCVGVVIVHAERKHEEFVEHYCYEAFGNKWDFVMGSRGSHAITHNWEFNQGEWNIAENYPLFDIIEDVRVERIWTNMRELTDKISAFQLDEWEVVKARESKNDYYLVKQTEEGIEVITVDNSLASNEKVEYNGKKIVLNIHEVEKIAPSKVPYKEWTSELLIKKRLLNDKHLFNGVWNKPLAVMEKDVELYNKLGGLILQKDADIKQEGLSELEIEGKRLVVSKHG